MILPLALAAVTTAAAGTLTATAPHYHAVRVHEAPVLDGKLDDAAWKEAPASSSFVQKSPDEGNLPSERTSFKIVYDDDALYVAFDCPQTTYPVVRRLTRRDRDVDADDVSLDIDTRGDGKSGFGFQVSAAGVLLDYVRFNDTDQSTDWDENWDARTDVRKDGWSVEIRIPFRILRFPTRDVQSWGLEARRWISTREESDEWAFFPRAMGGEVSHYGRLDDLRGLHSGAPLEVRPFVVGRVRRRDVVVGQLASGTDLHVSAGADVKWHPSQSLTLDADVQPGLRAGRSGSDRAEPEHLRDVLPGEAAVLPRRGGRVQYSVSTFVHAAHRQGGGRADAPDGRAVQRAAGRRPRADDNLRREQADRAARGSLDRRNAASVDRREPRAGAGSQRHAGEPPRRSDDGVQRRPLEARSRRQRAHRREWRPR